MWSYGRRPSESFSRMRRRIACWSMSGAFRPGLGDTPDSPESRRSTNANPKGKGAGTRSLPLRGPARRSGSSTWIYVEGSTCPEIFDPLPRKDSRQVLGALGRRFLKVPAETVRSWILRVGTWLRAPVFRPLGRLPTVPPGSYQPWHDIVAEGVSNEAHDRFPGARPRVLERALDRHHRRDVLGFAIPSEFAQ
jgi:hypothetical protein